MRGISGGTMKTLALALLLSTAVSADTGVETVTPDPIRYAFMDTVEPPNIDDMSVSMGGAWMLVSVIRLEAGEGCSGPTGPKGGCFRAYFRRVPWEPVETCPVDDAK